MIAGQTNVWLVTDPMLASTFATLELPKRHQFDAWCDWYRSVFEVGSDIGRTCGFEATNSNRTIGGFTISEVSSPSAWVSRSGAFLHRNPVDHWVVTLSNRTVSDVTARGESVSIRAGVPFLLSLGEELRIERRTADDRMQLLLARDAFRESAAILDAAVGVSLDTPQGALLADFMLMVKRNVFALDAQDAPHLKGAVQAMLEACLAPSADRLARAEKQTNLTLMERVRKAVTRNLRSATLNTAKLCREAATSRSQLYRLLEVEGGVARYIQRRRLSESFAILCDTSNDLPIGKIAEMLCFADASGFSRAFRREFGINPKDVRAASLRGLSPAPPPTLYEGDVAEFRDCLHSA